MISRRQCWYNMRLVLILATVTALCAAVPTPIELPEAPLENLVEGDRYKWMADGNGKMHVVDLLEKPSAEDLQRITRNAANNQYWLFTRNNPTNRQIITFGNANTIWISNFVASRPLVVINHGWNNNGNSAVNVMLTSAFLAAVDCNVIVVDWSHTSFTGYTTAMSAVPAVGTHVGQFVTWLVNTAGVNWNNVHFVGHSLGAHSVGNAGRATGNRPRRITGLDPAGPGWHSNTNQLRATDGQYVECIHTDGNFAGIMNPICQANFYPNGGGQTLAFRNCQPGCNCNPSCGHSRAYEFFASSVRTNHLIGRQCTNLAQANNNLCTGASVAMGNAVLNKNANGFFGLITGASWPY